MRINKSNISLLCVLAMTAGTAIKSQAIDIDLIITELNSNTLALSGGDASHWSITGGNDRWTLTRSGPLDGLGYGVTFASWYEKEDRSLINSFQASYYGDGGFTIDISSDQHITDDDMPAADSTPVLLSLFPNSSQIPYSVAFVDKGDSSGVPETTSTVMGLAMGLAPLLILKHCRKPGIHGA
jgi:hypothetical protein